MFRLDKKLAKIRSGKYAKGDFIIADAKDGDMSNPIPAQVPSAPQTAASSASGRAPNSSNR